MEPSENLRPVLSFQLGDETYGVRLTAVREIFDSEYLQPVPRSPEVIRGLADVRGRMVTVFDLPSLLGTAAPAGASNHLMILAEPRDHLALWCPSDIDLLNMDFETIAPRPGGDPDLEIFDGYVSSDGAIVNILSTEKIALLCEQEVLKRYRVAS